MAKKSKPRPQPKPSMEGDEHVAYEQGRAARRARISRDEPPHGDGPLLKAWQKGYDFEEQNGR